MIEEKTNSKVKASKKFLGLTDEEIIERIDLEYKNGFNFRKPAISEWHQNEDLLYGKKPKTLSKRSNIMIQLMAGFEDTLLSKIKQPIYIVYNPQETADISRAKKVTEAWKLESSVSRQDWEYKDLLVKKLAMVSGRGILKIYATSSPYAHRLSPIDHYDFIVDPTTNGMSLESARYLGQDNIILSKYQILKNPQYIQSKVKELIEAYADDNSESPDNDDQQKANRFAVLGLDYTSYFQAGDSSYKFLEWYTTINGVRCVFLYNKEKKILIRKSKLENITGFLENGVQPFWPFESWAYYPDLFNFWSPAPMSRVREIFQLRNISLNQMFDNNETKNKPMRAFDPKIYTNPALLTYAPSKLIPVAPGTNPAEGLYTLPSNDIIEPNQFNQILEELSGKITGVTSSGAGLSNQKKVGIYYGDQEEVGKRMTLFEISYNRCHLKLGQKYLKFLSERLDEKTSIKILGPDGIEYEELTSKDLADFDITITGGISQESKDALNKKTKNDFLTQQVQNPFFNKKFLIELQMALNNFSQDDIKKAISPIDKNENQAIRAAQDIEKILLGKKIKPFLKAEVSYMQYIFDYVSEKDLPEEDEKKILAYLHSIEPLVIQNMIEKAHEAMAEKGILEIPAEMQQQSQQREQTNAPALATQGGIDMQKAETIPSQVQSITHN